MKKDEVLQKVKSKKCVVGELENNKISKGNWIAVAVAGVSAVAFIIIMGALGNHSAQFAISSIIFAWASVLYTCQFVLAKRPWPVLIGAVLHGLAFALMIILFVISVVQGW